MEDWGIMGFSCAYILINNNKHPLNRFNMRHWEFQPAGVYVEFSLLSKYIFSVIV